MNEDYALFGLVRHSVTTCKAPCNGMATANYPFPDGGVVESGPMGYMVEDAYVTTTTLPKWTLDTASLNPGYYAVLLPASTRSCAAASTSSSPRGARGRHANQNPLTASAPAW